MAPVELPDTIDAARGVEALPADLRRDGHKADNPKADAHFLEGKAAGLRTRDRALSGAPARLTLSAARSPYFSASRSRVAFRRPPASLCGCRLDAVATAIADAEQAADDAEHYANLAYEAAKRDEAKSGGFDCASL